MSAIVTIDVRPLFATGQQPFSAIMQAADTLQPDQTLRIIAPFRPVPLVSAMERRGFRCAERQLDGADWQVDFTRADRGLGEGSSLEAADWPEPVQLFDLTGQGPPQSMIRILEELERLAPGQVVFALLDREPLFLLPQLREGGHAWVGNHAADGASYRLMVRRAELG